jgi:hypothetical protein
MMVHMGPRREYLQPLRISLFDVCILFSKKAFFSIEYYDPRSGFAVVRDFCSYELQFKFSFINDLIPDYFTIRIKGNETNTITVLIQSDTKVMKYHFIVDEKNEAETRRYKVNIPKEEE